MLDFDQYGFGDARRTRMGLNAMDSPRRRRLVVFCFFFVPAGPAQILQVRPVSARISAEKIWDAYVLGLGPENGWSGREEVRSREFLPGTPMRLREELRFPSTSMKFQSVVCDVHGVRSPALYSKSESSRAPAWPRRPARRRANVKLCSPISANRHKRFWLTSFRSRVCIIFCACAGFLRACWRDCTRIVRIAALPAAAKERAWLENRSCSWRPDTARLGLFDRRNLLRLASGRHGARWFTDRRRGCMNLAIGWRCAGLAIATRPSPSFPFFGGAAIGGKRGGRFRLRNGNDRADRSRPFSALATSVLLVPAEIWSIDLLFSSLQGHVVRAWPWLTMVVVAGKAVVGALAAIFVMIAAPLNLFNLVPLGMLDGARVVDALLENRLGRTLTRLALVAGLMLVVWGLLGWADIAAYNGRPP